MAPKILIIGATGAIGLPITEKIIAANSSFDRIAILTSLNTFNTKKDLIKSFTDRGVDVLVGDIESETEVKKAYEGSYPSFPFQLKKLTTERYRHDHLRSWKRSNPHTTGPVPSPSNSQQNVTDHQKHKMGYRNTSHNPFLPIRIRHRHRAQLPLPSRETPSTEAQSPCLRKNYPEREAEVHLFGHGTV